MAHHCQACHGASMRGMVRRLVDAWLRYVDGRPTFDIGECFNLDPRAAWHPRPGWELSVAGQKLLADSDYERRFPTSRWVRPRGVYGKVS